MAITRKKKSSYGFKIYPGEDGTPLRYTFYMDPPDIRVISLKGGGTRAIVYNEFIEIVDQDGLLKTVEEVGGSSSGSIASAFAAVHYEDPVKRTETLYDIGNVDKTDIYGDTALWLLYQVLTAPLYLVSKPFEWMSTGVNWAADKANQTLPGKFIGYPLKVIGVLLGLVNKLTSPRTIAGVGNLIARGAVYRGDKFQERVRHHYQRDVAAGLQAILNKLEHDERVRILNHLMEIGLCKRREDGKVTVVSDITFRHLHELTLLPGSQFKEYYTTGLRKRDKQMIVFNVENTPDMPVHLAIRLAITFPLYYQARTYQGDEYIDGGAVDNAPVQHAQDKPVNGFRHRHGVRDKLARLNVRVEYPHEHEHHLWKQQPPRTKAGELWDKFTRALAKKLTAGLDSFAADDEVTRIMKEDYAQRTLQIHDFGIGQMQGPISEETRHRIHAELPDIVHQYFANHANEKAVIENFQDLKYMGRKKRMKLLKVLQDDSIKTEDIFDMPGKTPEELALLRMIEIDKVQKATSIFDYQESDTSMIYRVLDVVPELSVFTLTPDSDGVVPVPVEDGMANSNNEAMAPIHARAMY